MLKHVQLAIDRLKEFQNPEGYYLAFSGGKDSLVVKQLLIMSGVKYDSHYNNTTIDPPPLVRYIREHHKDVIFHNPRVPFLRMLEKRGFPMRRQRWCCEVYKEGGGSFRTVVTGIRWEESQNRQKRRMVEGCYKDASKYYLNPIIDWNMDQVWSFIKEHGLPYCSLYNYGYKRVGCVLCPCASTKARQRDLIMFPKYGAAFKKAFCNLYHNLQEKGSHSIDRWSSGEDMFRWWLLG